MWEWGYLCSYCMLCLACTLSSLYMKCVVHLLAVRQMKVYLHTNGSHICYMHGQVDHG